MLASNWQWQSTFSHSAHLVEYILYRRLVGTCKILIGLTLKRVRYNQNHSKQFHKLQAYTQNEYASIIKFTQYNFMSS